LPFPAGGVLRRAGDRRAPKPVRRARGARGGARPAVIATGSAPGGAPLATGVPLQERMRSPGVPGPLALVVFGASGDLTRRKLMPAVFHLFREGLLPEEFAVVGLSREEWSDD